MLAPRRRRPPVFEKNFFMGEWAGEKVFGGENMKAAVAMSGGVDSSLTAALLLERGFDVIGLTMQLTADDDDLFASDRRCCSLNEASDARRVADFLGISHYVIDLRADFYNYVVKYFVKEYIYGKTPNPCVECNKFIKFGALFDYAMELGADYFATGHYARVERVGDRYQLLKGVDTRKDQSYVLYNLRAEQLPKIILPLGAQSKDETRRLAEKFNLPVAHKPDSQEICFVPNDDYKNFLRSNAPSAPALEHGYIVDRDRKILGRHEGAAFYTIGQRKGLGIAAPEPLYVVGTDVERRQVIVGHSSDLFSTTLTVRDAHWIYPVELPLRAEAKIRYSPRVAPCTVRSIDNRIAVEFDEPQRAITGGQSIVFYDDKIVLGGGKITVDAFTTNG